MVSRSFSRFSHAMDTKRVRMDGSVSPSTAVEEKPLKKSAASSTVERYKAHLHAIFDGKKPLPEHIRGLQNGTEKDEPAHISDASAAEQNIECAASDTKAGGDQNVAGQKTLRRIQQAKGVCYDTLLGQIKQAVSTDEVTAAADAFLAAGFHWPQDEDTLSKMLGHRDEKVLHAALTELKKLFESSAPKNPRLLKSRIDNIALLAHSSDVLALCTALRTTL